MDLTLQSLAETRKQSLQSWVPIDFSGITCISKGLQDMTQCPISSKTKCTWKLVPRHQKGVVYLPDIYSSYGFVSAYLFYTFFVFWPTEPHCYVKSTSSPSILSIFFTVSSTVILSSELMPALTALSSFGSLFYVKKKYFGLGTVTVFFN